MYQEIVDYTRDETSKQLNSEIGDLGGQVPVEVTKALNAELRKRTSERFTTVRQDAVCKQVYDLEREWRKKQIREIIELIGDIPKYSIGTEIREQGNGTSVDKLIENVLKLPIMDVANEEREIAETAFKILTEYTNLRMELVRKCEAIRLGELRLQERQQQVTMIESLFNAIDECGVSDVQEYFTTYKGKVSNGLQDASLQLEDAVKSAESNSVKRSRLQEIIDEL